MCRAARSGVIGNHVAIGVVREQPQIISPLADIGWLQSSGLNGLLIGMVLLHHSSCVSNDTPNKHSSREKTSWVAKGHVAASLQITMFMHRAPGSEK